jgi:hypothetical protein
VATKIRTTKKAKTAKKRKRIMWTRSSVAELRRHSRDKTPVIKLIRLFRRSGPTLRQKARTLGLPLGHTRGRKKR